jgi:Glyoxalase/Bleomycin resistance protein/Dioxygenase superfamily
MTQVNVRYMVHDVDAAVAFYTTHLGFALLSNKSPAFADVVRGDLRLLLSGPTSSAGRPMPDGRKPEPDGWNRIHLIVIDIEVEVDRLHAKGVRFPTTLLEVQAEHRSLSRIHLATSSNSSSPPVETDTKSSNRLMAKFVKMHG